MWLKHFFFFLIWLQCSNWLHFWILKPLFILCRKQLFLFFCSCNSQRRVNNPLSSLFMRFLSIFVFISISLFINLIHFSKKICSSNWTSYNMVHWVLSINLMITISENIDLRRLAIKCLIRLIGILRPAYEMKSSINLLYSGFDTCSCWKEWLAGLH